MKLHIAIILASLAAYASAVKAQNNCCMIQLGGTQTTGGPYTVPPTANNPGGTYYPSQTQTTPVACVDSATSKPCNSTSQPNNVVVATGTYGYAFGLFIPCNPTFKNSGAVQSSSTNAYYTNVGTSG
jgi:hypothetical protein